MQQGPNRGYTTLKNILAQLCRTMDACATTITARASCSGRRSGQAKRFVNDFQHVVSSDVYWFTDPHVSRRGPARAASCSMVAALNANSRTAGGELRAIRLIGLRIGRQGGAMTTDLEARGLGWPYRETAAQGGRAIEPAEIKAAVWHSIIAGARGIIYFVHSFGGPNQSQNVLRDPEPLPAYAAHRAAVTETNALIKQLASVLNAPFADGFASAGPSVRTMAKFHANKYYVFAGSRENKSSTPTLKLSGVESGAATVLGENRTIPIANGQFSDCFADGNAVHIYKIDSQ